MSKKKKSLKKDLELGIDSVRQDSYDKLMFKDLFDSQKSLKDDEQQAE